MFDVFTSDFEKTLRESLTYWQYGHIRGSSFNKKLEEVCKFGNVLIAT